jgi:DNA-binding transcriptional MerR regulator/methylmalonyl-CoA mutase cobalamin-binding subunit
MPSKPLTQHDTYPLRTVSRLTGLSPDLIRAWEKRYGVVSPERGARGARLYRPDDIAHLRLLARAVGGGRAIGDVASLSRDQLRDLVAAEPPPDIAEEGRPAASPSADAAVARALAAVERFDVAGLTAELGSALAALGTADFVRKICGVLLHEAGDRWEHGHLSIGQEHLLSSALHSMLHALLHWGRRPRAGHVLLATAPGEAHEAGILMTALLLSEAGVAVTYLGCETPASEILVAVERCSDVRVVGLGATDDTNIQQGIDCAREIDHGLSAGKELWLGGRVADAVAASVRSDRIYVIGDERQLDARIAELGGALR